MNTDMVSLERSIERTARNVFSRESVSPFTGTHALVIACRGTRRHAQFGGGDSDCCEPVTAAQARALMGDQPDLAAAVDEIWSSRHLPVIVFYIEDDDESVGLFVVEP